MPRQNRKPVTDQRHLFGGSLVEMADLESRDWPELDWRRTAGRWNTGWRRVHRALTDYLVRHQIDVRVAEWMSMEVCMRYRAHRRQGHDWVFRHKGAVQLGEVHPLLGLAEDV